MSRFSVPPEKIAFYRAHGASRTSPCPVLVAIAAHAHAHPDTPGWVVLEDFVSPAEVSRLRGIAEDMVAGRIATRRNRADLGAHAEARVVASVENIIQIGWPTDLTSLLDENELIQASRSASEQLYGDAAGTWAMDMNQLLIKMAHTLTDTPLHQDQSYYIPLPDPRGCNVWLALQDVDDAMGCLWFGDSPLDAPAPMQVHRPAGRGGGALECGAGPDFSSMTPAPLRAGSVTIHSHMTPHYAKGNATPHDRYAYVVQTRPAAAVREARMRGFDHGRAANTPREVNNVAKAEA